MTAHDEGFVVAGPAGYLGRPEGCCIPVHNCTLDEAYVFHTEQAAVHAQRAAMAAGGVALTVHGVDATWLRMKRS